MNRNLGLLGWILCTKQCAISLLDSFAEEGLVQAVMVREGKARLMPDPFGNYVIIPTMPACPVRTLGPTGQTSRGPSDRAGAPVTFPERARRSDIAAGRV